jgi:endonuclease/exonuclease/phosphatase family metal-dependent hydrolase
VIPALRKGFASLLLAGLFACHSAPDLNPGAASTLSEYSVMTYNIRHGVGLDRHLDLSRIAAVIAYAAPDFVILNEVDEGTQRSFFVRQADSLGRMLKMQARFGRSIDYDGGEYGNALLSKWPILSFDVIDLSMEPNLEGRSVFLAELLLGADTLSVMGTHLGLQQEEQMLQVERIIASLPRTQKFILAGDLNFEPVSAQYAILAEPLQDGVRMLGKDGFTFPADKPDRRIDYIFLGEAIQPLRTADMSTDLIGVASDHLPQGLVFRIK